MINVKNVELQNDTAPVSAYLGIGVHELKINKIEAEKASTGSYRVRFDMETPAVEGLTHPEGNAGKTCRVRTYYLANTDQQEDFVRKIKKIAEAFGVLNDLRDEYSDFEDMCNHISPLLSNGKFAFYRVVGQEYEKSTGGTGLALHFSRWNWFATTEEGGDSLPPVDANNPYDLKKVEVVNTTDTIVNGDSSAPRMY